MEVKAEPSSTLVTFFNLQYYSALSPFKVDRDRESGELILRRSLLQMIFCAILHAISLSFSICTYIYDDSFFAVSSDISRLLGLIGSLANSIVSKYISKVIWLNQNEILDFLRSLEKFGKQEPSKNVSCKGLSNTKSTMRVDVVITVVALASFYGLHIYINYVTKLANNASERMLSWFVHPVTVNSNIRGIWLAIVCYSAGLYATSRLATMILCIEYFILGRRFEKLLKQEFDVHGVIAKFENLRLIVVKGKSWTNALLIWACIGVLAYVANIPQMLRGEGLRLTSYISPVANVYLCYNYLAFGVLFLIASDMPTRVCESCKCWIYRMRLEPDTTEKERFLMLSLSQQVEVEPMGVSCTFFTVTFKFLGSLMGLVATYGVLVFQIQK